MRLSDEILVKAFRVIAELSDNPRPRGCERVEGRANTFRVWIDRKYRVVYEIDAKLSRIRVQAVRSKGKSTYR